MTVEKKTKKEKRHYQWKVNRVRLKLKESPNK
jgi:hypothetical protein